MRKRFTKIICLTVAFIVALGVALLSACGGTFKGNKLSGDISGEIASNGGFVVKKGGYIYFINGVETNTANNDFGKPVKGAVMRISVEDFNNRNYANTQTVVPLVMYSSAYDEGLYINGDYVYYSTPSTERNSDGEIQNGWLEFKRTKLDGTETIKDSFLQYKSTTLDYRFVDVKGTVYLMYVATDEDYFDNGTKCKNLHSVNTVTGEDTLLAYNLTSYIFDENIENARVYYTMSVTDYTVANGSYASVYNQIYTVTADETERNEYDFSNVDASYEYDAEKNPLYVNCGDLVLDGIGRFNAATPFNGASAQGEVNHQAITYALKLYQNGKLYYSGNHNDQLTEIYSLNETEALANGWDAVKANDGATLLLGSGYSSAVDNYTFLQRGDEQWVAYADGNNIRMAKIENGSLADTAGNYNFVITKDSAAPTILFTAVENEKPYLYYSLSGGNGYTVYRIAYDGAKDDYFVNKRPLPEVADAAKEYKSVQVLNVDCASGWYKPEIIENQLVFATQTQHMTDYSYIMVADLRAEDGKIMNNAQLEEYTEKFKGVTEEITEFEKEFGETYENLANAYRFAYFTNDGEYLDTLIKAYVDVMGYREEHFYSAESVAKYKDFVNCTGDWEEYAGDTRKINGVEFAANKLGYYYSLMGAMTEEDAEAYRTTLVNTYLKEYPTNDKGWYGNLSTSGKVGFIIGMCAIGLVVIGGVVVAVILILRYKKNKRPAMKKHKIKVDTYDDKSVDVYADDKTEPENGSAAENSEESNQ